MKFGIIGSGFITHDVIVEGRKVKGFEPYALYSRTLERGNEFAEEHSIPVVYTDLDEMGKDENIDAVYVASPNSIHMSQTIKMLNYGKHVLCEKPVASNREELEEMIACAKKNKRVFLEAMRSSFNPAMQELKNELKGLGSVKEARFTYAKQSSRYNLYKEGKQTNTFDPQYSNSALMDLGVYCASLMIELFGDPDGFDIECEKLSNDFLATGEINAKYDDFNVKLIFSKIEDISSQGEIFCKDGKIHIDHCAMLTNITVTNKNGERRFGDSKGNDLVYQMQAFINCCMENASTEEEHMRSLLTMKLLDDAHAKCGIKFGEDRNE
jgi:predicted dehydrogenase